MTPEPFLNAPRRIMISLAIVILASLVLWGPTGLWHYNLRFGVLGYMVVSREDPPEMYRHAIFGRGVSFSTVEFLLSLGLWLGALLACLVWVQRS